MTKAQKNFMDVSSIYLSDLSAGAADETVKSRAERLSYYLACMEENNLDPGILAVLAWKKQMKENGLKLSTIKQRLVELSAFYKWAVEHHFYEENPVMKSDMPKVMKNPYTDLLTEKEMMLLLTDRRPKWAKATYWERNRAIVILFLTTGMRNSELGSLLLSDLNWEEGEIFIRSGKGDKDRFVSFPDLAQVAIKKYLAVPFRPKSVGENAPLFGYMKDGTWLGIERNGITKMVYRYVERVAGRNHIGSHDLRHAAASLMLTSGETMENIQQDLGHADLSTTKIYAQRLRPNKAHIKSANRIWNEMDYQTRKGTAELSAPPR